jgi:hypothetical protein
VQNKATRWMQKSVQPVYMCLHLQRWISNTTWKWISITAAVSIHVLAHTTPNFQHNIKLQFILPNVFIIGLTTTLKIVEWNRNRKRIYSPIQNNGIAILHGFEDTERHKKKSIHHFQQQYSKLWLMKNGPQHNPFYNFSHSLVLGSSVVTQEQK